MTTPSSKFVSDPPNLSSPLGNLESARWIYLKGGLLFFLGVLSAFLLITRLSEWSEVALLAIAIWAFCRAYYFAFYVIEHYVDPGYRFDGLVSCVRYLLSPRRERTDDQDGVK